MQIKISVVVPTYKRAGLLQKCLHQLVNQTLEKSQYEVIVVSDGPDSESQKVINDSLSDASANIRFLSLPNKKGPAAARNLGWQNANGVLIAFTDDDCLPHLNWLQNIIANYNDEKEIAFAGKMIVPVSDSPTDFELNTKRLEDGEFVTANCVVTKAALQNIGGFDEQFKTAWREDSDIHFKLINRNIPILKLNEAIVVHPVRKAPWGVSIKEQKKTIYNALLFKKNPVLFRQRIKKRPQWSYYLIILFSAVFIVAAFLKIKWIMAVGLICWLLLTITFMFKRISSTQKTPGHIFEMIVTSMIIPFLSVWWTLYGSIKYRVLFF